MNTFTFKTREEYFEYKAEWKEEYFTISKEIRKAALAMSEKNSDKKTRLDMINRVAYVNKGFTKPL